MTPPGINQWWPTRIRNDQLILRNTQIHIPKSIRFCRNICGQLQSWHSWNFLPTEHLKIWATDFHKLLLQVSFYNFVNMNVNMSILALNCWILSLNCALNLLLIPWLRALPTGWIVQIPRLIWAIFNIPVWENNHCRACKTLHLKWGP